MNSINNEHDTSLTTEPEEKGNNHEQRISPAPKNKRAQCRAVIEGDDDCGATNKKAMN